MKSKYLVNTDDILVKSVLPDTEEIDTLRKAIKIRLFQEAVKDEGVVINKAFALLGALSDE